MGLADTCCGKISCTGLVLAGMVQGVRKWDWSMGILEYSNTPYYEGTGTVRVVFYMSSSSSSMCLFQNTRVGAQRLSALAMKLKQNVHKDLFRRSYLV